LTDTLVNGGDNQVRRQGLVLVVEILNGKACCKGQGVFLLVNLAHMMHQMTKMTVC